MMKIELERQQTYVVAVSGGVDSVALLDILVQSQPASRLLVAHFDHGMRDESVDEAKFVEKLAQKYGLPFVLGRASLGAEASEDQARRARYLFLEKTQKEHAAAALILAHHRDDFLETAIINFHRGCQRRGLVSLKSTSDRLRPLLDCDKAEIIAYAQRRGLEWREDESNHNPRYLRNYVRQSIMPKLRGEKRQHLLKICAELSALNRQLDDFLDNYLRQRSYRRAGRVFSRSWFNQFNHLEASEIVATWLIKYRVSNYTQSQIDYIVVKLKTLPAGKTIVVGSNQTIKLTKRCLRLEL